MRYISFFMLGVLAVSLHGCSFNVLDRQVDYDCDNSSGVRVRDLGDLILMTYVFDKEKGCYKITEKSKLTSGFAVMGLPLQGKKTVKMTASDTITGYAVKEYRIKSGVYHTVFRAFSNGSYRYRKFLPQAGHDYDIEYDGYAVRIKDLTTRQDAPQWEGELCKMNIWGW